MHTLVRLVRFASFACCAALSLPAAELQTPAWLSGVTPRAAQDPALIRGPGVVRWRAYGAEAFAEAARTNKPVFLFVTAHWNSRGKLMERVTFSELAIATRLNDEFIPVRLNRDERPDADVRLQQASRALGGSHGLPLSVVLTPDGRPFFSGTFFNADDDPISERPGLITVIHKLANTWRNSRAGLQTRAGELDAAMQKDNETESTRGDLEKIKIEALLASAQQMLAVHALATAPTQNAGLFPAPRVIEFCLAHHAITADKRSLELAALALDAMLRGGIYDQLDGGFYRSSTDPFWLVPRFEKLLGMNAEMTCAALHLWQKTGDARCRRAVEETLRFWLSLREPGGNFFYGSQAGGSSDVDDGEFATWSVKEIERALRDETDCRLAKLVFDIQESGELPAALPDRNVLYEALPLAEAAKRLKLALADAEERWPRIREALRKARAARQAPTLDKNVYVDANARMAAALIECGAAMKNPEWTEQGVKTLRALLKSVVREGPSAGAMHLLRVEKVADCVRLLSDEAALLDACAAAFAASADKTFLNEADECLRRMDEKFWDKANGGYFDRFTIAPDAAGLAWRTKMFQDTSEPSPNGLAAAACLKLAAASGQPAYALKARSIVEAFGGALEPLGPYAATLGAAAFGLKNQK